MAKGPRKSTGASSPTAKEPFESRIVSPDDMPEDKDSIYEQLQGFEKELEEHGEKMGEYCDKVDEFIAGGHYGLTKDEMSDLADSGDEAGEWPTVAHTFEVIDKQTAALTRYQTRPKVIAEDAADFAMLPEQHPFKLLASENQAIFKRKTDNEIFAEIMSARLETALERGGYDEIFDDAAECAARYRRCDILVRAEADNNKEVAVLELLDPADVDADPRAPRGKIELGRFIRYRIRRTAKWVRDNLGYEPKYSDSNSESYSYHGSDSNTELSDYSYKDEKVAEDDKLIDIWVWFVKDHTMVDKTVEIEETELVLGPDGAPIQDPRTGEPLQRTVIVKETSRVPKYHGGWKMVYKVKKKVISVQDNPNANPRPPIHRFEWVRNPRTSRPMSIYDLDKDANQAIDHSFKYALENSNRSQSKVLFRREAIPEPEDAIENEVMGMIAVDHDGPLQDAFQIVPANPLSGAHLELGMAFINVQDKALGAVDIREPGGGANRVTGDAVEGMNGPDADRMDKRMRRWLRFKKEIFHDVLSLILKYEDRERTVVLGRDWGQPTYLSYDPTVFDFEEWEFEARWDIVMREPDDLPMNRAKRNTAKLEIMNTILDLPPNRAKMALKFLSLEDEAALSIMLDEELEMLAQQPPPPSETEIEQQKAQIEIEKEREITLIKSRLHASQAIGDAMERMADDASKRGNTQLAIQILQLLPQAAQEAMDGLPAQQNQAFNQAVQAQGQFVPPMPGGAPGPIM